MEEEGNTGRSKWTPYHLVEKEGRTLIVHGYEQVDQPWSQGYKIFLKGEGENNLTLLYQSERNYYKREKALEVGKIHAEKYEFESKSKVISLLEIIARIAAL